MTTASWQNRSEEALQVLMLLAIGGMAGAASFTHVHDWTMHNSPDHTAGWFGWANAVVSEFMPIASGLEIRRRRRRDPEAAIGYPLAVLIGSACFSLAAQVSQAKPSPSGWLLAALPAIGFLVLAKMVLSRPADNTATDPAPVSPMPEQEPAPSPLVAEPPTHTAPAPVKVLPAVPVPTVSVPRPEVPAHLLGTARFSIVNHEQTTGRPITPAELAARMSLSPEMAAAVLDELGHPAPSPARANGVPVLTGEARA